MTKRPSLIKQVVDAFKSLQRFGQSRHEAKQVAIDEARLAGFKGWNPARVEGVHSVRTMKTYIKESIAFTDWVKQAHGSRWLDEARPFVKEYLNYRLSLGHSASTVKTSRAALAKLYQDHQLHREVPLPIRRKQDIKRSRGPKAMDAKFSEARNRDLVDFCRAAGLRRHELVQLRAGDVYVADGQLYIRIWQGKGGRPRTVPVLPAMQERVMQIIAGKQPDDAVIEKIPVRADVHGYRREFAQALYANRNGAPYDPKNRNLDAAQLVSAALGHRRLDVVFRNYLD